MSTARSRSVADAQIPSGVGDTRMPISPSFVTTISRCSSRTPSSSISPPAMPHAMRNVPASMRSPMISVSHGTSPSTPSIRIVLVPAPMMCAPMRLRNAVRSVISGSRAAFSMTVSPFASTAAVIRFSVAPTLGKSSTMRAPFSLWQRASTKPCATSSSAPIVVQAAEVHVELAAADVVAAGQRDPRLAAAGEQRAEHVDRRPHPADQLVRRLGRRAAPTVSMCSSSGPAHSTSAPTARSTAIITSRSATGGRLRTTVTPGASSAAASCFEPGVLRRAGDLDRARRAAARAVRRRHPSGDQG